MMRHVCIVSNTLADGGAERWASNTCTYLAGQHDLIVSLILFRNEQSYPCPDSVKVRVIDHRYFVHTFRTVRQLRRMILRDQVDVVISNGAFTGQFVGQAIRGTNARWIARISGNIAKGQRNILQRLGWCWLDRNIQRATAIVANSANLTREARTRWPGLIERAVTIPNGVDIPHLISALTQPKEWRETERPPRPILLAAGRLHSQKRPDIFLHTVRILQNSFDFEAYWCGDGPLRDETERLVIEMGLEGCVRIIGFRSDLPAWMRRAACFVMTSDHEGSPNVLAEAMAIGVPVVTTNCDHGPGELLADGRGWLAPVGDSAKIAAAIAEVLSNPDEAQRRASKAQRWVQENLDLKSIGACWKKLIDDCLQSQPQQGKSPAGRTA